MVALATFCAVLLQLTQYLPSLANDVYQGPTVTFVVIGQETERHAKRAASLSSTLRSECAEKCSVIDSSRDLEPPVIGHWTIWTLFKRLKSQKSSWVVFLEDGSNVRLQSLLAFLSGHDANQPKLFGCGLFDKEPTIIHHFGFDLPTDRLFLYPDFSCGFAVSSSALKLIAEKVASDDFNPPGFAIDPKHELNLELDSDPEKFCFEDNPDCLIFYEKDNLDKCPQAVQLENIHFMIKTFSGFHRTRLVVVKRTWTRDLPSVEYCSDTVDPYVPTIDMGVNNTQRGHCAKTWAMLTRFAEQKAEGQLDDVDWLFIADDDTLVSVERLRRLLSCYNSKEKMIIAERYGYGFSVDGTAGYDYPTGGPGMAFSLPAVTAMLAKCGCPSDSSPDDMIIGMCAQSVGIPIVHNAGFHQARAHDYAPEYLRKTLTISLHKFEDIDPYKDYMTHLHVETTRPTLVHNEL